MKVGRSKEEQVGHMGLALEERRLEGQAPGRLGHREQGQGQRRHKELGQGLLKRKGRGLVIPVERELVTHKGQELVTPVEREGRMVMEVVHTVKLLITVPLLLVRMSIQLVKLLPAMGVE